LRTTYAQHAFVIAAIHEGRRPGPKSAAGNWRAEVSSINAPHCCFPLKTDGDEAEHAIRQQMGSSKEDRLEQCAVKQFHGKKARASRSNRGL
jgi:hypothetical protein